jgi:hypothetical protein
MRAWSLYHTEYLKAEQSRLSRVVADLAPLADRHARLRASADSAAADLNAITEALSRRGY